MEELFKVREKLILTSVLVLELSKTKLVGVVEMGDLNPNIFETLAIDNLSNDNWRTPIIEFLKNLTGTTDRNVRYRALNYVIIENELFKKTP